MSNVSKAALALFDAGITTIPIALDGSKRPIGMWGEWIEGPPPRAQVDLMFKKACGIAVLCGPTSGGLECIDFDQPGYFENFADLLNDIAHSINSLRSSSVMLCTLTSVGPPTCLYWRLLGCASTGLGGMMA